MAQGLEQINRKISTQFKLLELAEKETERLLTRNKNNDIEKHLQHVELKVRKITRIQVLGATSFIESR